MKRRIVTTTAVFEPGYPAEKAIDRLAGLGFDALDMAFSYCVQKPEYPFLGGDYLKWAEGLRARAERAGVAYVQSHAPGDAEGHLIGRTLRAAGAVGAGYMVLHPVCVRADGTAIDDEEEFIARNHRAVEPWLETARRCGVVILSENLFDGAAGDPRIIAELVRRVGSEWFGWCCDTGHAHCLGYRPSVLRECAVAPLSLHMHDNRAARDDHMIPGEGTIDWREFIEALRDVRYAGDCVLEAHEQSLETPDDERDAVLTRLLAAARPLRAQMEEF